MPVYFSPHDDLVAEGPDGTGFVQRVDHLDLYHGYGNWRNITQLAGLDAGVTQETTVN